MQIEEQTYYRAKAKGIFRPFSEVSGIKHKHHSLKLQRVISDFGSDHPFNKVHDKLQEHYGIRVGKSVPRTITLKHAANISKTELKEEDNTDKSDEKIIISETDGVFVPIVSTRKINGDKRKGRSTFYKEARLTMAHQNDSKDIKFAATMGSVNKVGKNMLRCAKKAGMNENSKIHAVGDGAQWIQRQVEQQFAEKGKYLIDFYHLCEYISAAAIKCFRFI